MPKSSVSPTQRSLKKLRDEGYLCRIVEHWNPFARIRQDLFGFIDILCVKNNEVVGVQSCSGVDFNKRVTKIKEHKNYNAVSCSGIKIRVQAWRKLKAGWACREIEL